MRVCVAGTADLAFSRNRRLLRLLNLSGISTNVITRPLWPTDRSTRTSARWLGQLPFRLVWTYIALSVRLLREPRPDVYVVGHPGWFDVPIVKLVGRLRRVPVLFDAFISLYDTLVLDRRRFGERTLVARAARWVDRMSAKLADRVLVDTPQNAEFLAKLAEVPTSKIGVLWVGADDQVFQPLDPKCADAASPRRVLFYGSYIPLQGSQIIAYAAKLLEGEDVEFLMVGTGQDRQRVEELLSSLQVSNVELIDDVQPSALPALMADSAICLGIFGESDKADRVIPHKVFEALAAGRPVITGDTTAIRTALPADTLVTVPVGDPEALAARISALLADPSLRQALAARAQRLHRERFHEEVLAEVLKRELELTTKREGSQ